MSAGDNAARRSADRERRRNRSEDGAGEDTAMQAVRSAAAAAAVGAAVGAARAFKARSDEADSHEEDSREQEAPPEPDPPREPEPAPPQPRQERPRRSGAPAEKVRSIADRARDQLEDLQGRRPESVSSLERTPEGWRVTFEVVEVERVPASTDVLATYLVELDGDGELLCYERLRRYYRAQVDGGGER